MYTLQITCYRIRHYSDLDELLGKGWHFRGLNSIGDYCFVVPDTVEYYLCHRRPIVHFVPNNDGSPVKVCTPQGFMLHFTFVRGDQTLEKTRVFLVNIRHVIIVHIMHIHVIHYTQYIILCVIMYHTGYHMDRLGRVFTMPFFTCTTIMAFFFA